FQVGKETTVFIPPETLLERASVAALAESSGDQPPGFDWVGGDVPLGLGFEIADAFGVRNQVADGPKIGDLFMTTIGFLERKLFTNVLDRFVIGGHYNDLMAL